MLEVTRNPMGPAIADWDTVKNGLAHNGRFTWWAWALLFNTVGPAVAVVGPGGDECVRSLKT